MTLHLFRTSPAQTPDWLEQFYKKTQPHDRVLLLDEACYIQQYATISPLLQYCERNDIGLYMLTEHLISRGLPLPPVNLIHSIGYPEFVTLTLTHTPIITW
jgi:sulfur relay protein TusB/DsrH